MSFFSGPMLVRRSAFTLTEVMVAVGVIGVLFVSLYLAFTAGFSMIRATRENLGATEALVQRAETIRLYSWSQFNDPTFFPTNFTNDATTTLGTTYFGTVERNIPNFPNDSPNYANDLRIVTISVRWTNGYGKPMPHYRAMQTLVAKNGASN